MMVLVGIGVSYAQPKQVSGTVFSAEDKTPIPGVSVYVKEASNIGTTTNIDGQFSLKNLPANAKTLVFRFVGFQTQEMAIKEAEVKVSLMPETQKIEEVVVTGYGVQKKREVTGAISQVKADKISSLASPSFESQLAGRVTGVQITAPSGIIGQAPTIRIRGTNTISSGADPLIVVDGIPVYSGNAGSVVASNALGDINPSDIESYEVLKDGAATAIYGSRAANGVILITTKKGKQGMFNVSYNNYFGVAKTAKRFDLLKSNDFVTIQNEKYKNAGSSTVPASNTGSAGEAVETDWWNVIFRTGIQQDHTLSMSGSNDKTNYYTSIGYNSQEGTSIGNSMKRYSIRANVQQKATKWLTFGINSALSRTQYEGLNTGANSLSGNIFSVIRQHPNVPVMNPNHTTGYNIDFSNPDVVGRWNNNITIGDNVTNIKFVLDNNVFKQISNRFMGATFAEAKIMEGLIFRTQFGVDAIAGDGMQYGDPRHGDGKGSNGYLYQTYEPSLRWNQQNVLSYNHQFAEVHNVSATLVAEYQKQQNKYFAAEASDISDRFYNQNIVSGSFSTHKVYGGMTERGFESYAARVNYNYASKYFAQFSVRRDAISSLPTENKVGYFPGGSIGWTISEEPFLKEVAPFISDLKVRASYAEVGNVEIGNYPYLGLYSPAKYASQNGLAFGQIGNDQLMWETSKKWDIGLDLSLFDGKYKFNADYFLNNTDGLILAVPVANSLGVPGNSINKNIGKIKNDGIELTAEASIIRTKDFGLSLDANLTLSRNKVEELVAGQNEIISTYSIIRVGESINSLYGYDYVGANKANGNPIYRKADGTLIQGDISQQKYFVYDPANPTNLTTASSLAASDRKILGQSLPSYFGSFGIKSNYKAFDLGILFRYSGGNKIMNRTRQDLLGQNFTNNGTEILGRWQSPENPGDGVTPRLYNGRGNFINLEGQTVSRFVESANFVKLSNIQIGYTLPESFASRIGIKALRVFVQGQNLLTFTKYTGLDPELSNTSFLGSVDYNVNPFARIYTGGISLKF